MKRLELRLSTYPLTGAPLPRAIHGPRDAARACADLRGFDREHFVVLHLDAQNRLLARETVAVGSLTKTWLTAREVFKGAVVNNSAAVVLVHNHPSGDATPSDEDRAVTARLEEAGRILGIPVLDHVVVAAGGCRSTGPGACEGTGRRVPG